MPKFIVKLQEHYMEYGTVVDAPTTFGMLRSDFEDYYRKQYGESGMRELPARLARVNAKGTSAHDDKSAHDTMRLNRAGPDECRLTVKQIYESHCLMQSIRLRGKVYQFDDNRRWQQVDAGVKASAMEENNASN